MQISRRVTNGLAWAGLFIVVGVPSADVITAQFMGEPETIGSAVAGAPIVLDVGEKPRLDQTTTATVNRPADPEAPTPAPASVRSEVAAADPVEQYLQSGRELPSYITGGEDETAAAPELQAEPTEIAVTPQPEAPAEPVDTAATPEPRPAPAQPSGEQADVAAVPAQTGSNATVTTTARPPVIETDPVEVAALDPDARIAPVPMPLSMRPTPRTAPTLQSEAIIIPSSVQAAPDYPVVPPQAVAGYDDVVTAEELEDWESGPLSEFLAERGQGGVNPDYDADGFFLDEGPNSSAFYRREQVEPPVVYVYPLYN